MITNLMNANLTTEYYFRAGPVPGFRRRLDGCPVPGISDAYVCLPNTYSRFRIQFDLSLLFGLDSRK